MKRILPFILMIFIACASFGQKATVTSIANGDFGNVNTWDCNCQPLDGDIIIVNHRVVLDQDFGISMGSFTISASGSLVKNTSPRSFWIYDSGVFTNNGLFDIDNMVAGGGMFTNNDSLLISGFLINDFGFTNNGVMQPLDSFTNNGNFINTSNGKVTSSRFLNKGLLVNYGSFQTTSYLNKDTTTNSGQITASYLQNNGLMNNSGTITVPVNFLNMHHFHNNTGGNLNVSVNFMNGDSIFHTCTFANSGGVRVAGNWLNNDTVKGTSSGHFCVHGNSMNTAQMLGNFDFCDLTNIGSSVVDFPAGGFIAPTITKCTYNCNAADVAENAAPGLSVYPNPFTEELVFDLGNLSDSRVTITISDIQGRNIVTEVAAGSQLVTIDCRKLASGLYFYSLFQDGSLRYSGKVIRN